MTEYVSVDACQRTREAMYKDLGNVEGELCSHNEDLTDMKVAIARLTIIQENLQTKNAELISSFWQSETGKRLVMGLFTLFAVIVFVALDQNIGIIDNLLGK